jgi:hypothetical protein
MGTPRTERIQRIKALVRELQTRYRNDPNVVEIGWGMAKRGGKLVPELAVIFHVREKYSSEPEIKNAGSQPVARDIEGFATDVQKRVALAPQWAGTRNDKMADPLVGGVATTNLEKIHRTFFWSYGGAGTLGILCRDASGTAMALSNWHVWADQGAKNGDRIIQPSTPEGGTYAESIFKVGACGPFLTSIIEGRTPSPLAAGLYAGAAAVGILAAATDHKDPIRRGQELTPVNATTFTHSELLHMDLGFPVMIPWVGQPFPVDVHWRYARQTNAGEQTVEIQERRVNPQIVLGQSVAPDRAFYRPGETVTMQAAIWDYQDRPADAYQVTAHLISVEQPEYVLRAVLHPALCRPINLAPVYTAGHQQQANPITRDGDWICVAFAHFSPANSFATGESFGPFAVFQRAREALRIVRLSDEVGTALLVPAAGLTVQHPPATAVRVRVAQLTSRPVSIRAFNQFGQQLGEVSAPNVQNQIHELIVGARLITRVEIRGGGGEGLLVSYCLQPAEEDTTTTLIPDALLDAYREIDVPFASRPERNEVVVRRRCFRGQRRLPQDAPAGKYRIYMTVSNVNHVPPGTPPIEAARVIGGQELGTHSQALVCTFMMLGDHVFDIF